MNYCMIKSFCSGCGLCQSIGGIEVLENKQGFIRPLETLKEVSNVCPAVHAYRMVNKTDQEWGDYISVYTGYSADQQLRRQASSGGIITQTSSYLLEKDLVDGILQIGYIDNNPLHTCLYCSTTKENVKNHCGSRYSPSAPLLNIKQYLDLGKRYAFVGKPCDIRGIRLLCEQYPEYKKCILYTLSFFCAGTPSIIANENLVRAMGGDTNNIKAFTYRGNGWPGQAILTDREENNYTMSYELSWGAYLGRDVQRACRFCWDGIGEEADISCADAWYIKNNGPDFKEKPGRNVIFARTNIGNNLLERMVKDRVVHVDEYDLNELKIIQKYQYLRRATMPEKISALRLCFKVTPPIKCKRIALYNFALNNKDRFKIFFGTVKRILKKQI